MIANAVRHPAQQNCGADSDVTRPAGTGSWQCAHATSVPTRVAAGARTAASAGATRHLRHGPVRVVRARAGDADLSGHREQADDDGCTGANEWQSPLERTEQPLRAEP